MKASMRKLVCEILVIMAIGLSLSGIDATYSSAAGEASQQRDQGAIGGGFRFKTKVDLVTVEVSVIGKPTREPRAEDFIIYDNDAAHEVSYFSRDKYPLAIALLVDRSPSIGQYLPILQIASLSLYRRLKPEDEVVLYSFDTKRHRLTDLTQDRKKIVEEIAKIKVPFTYGTFVYDPIVDAALYLKKEAPNSHRAIIMLSDNLHIGFGGESGGYSPDDAREKALQTASTVYSIRTPAEGGMIAPSDSNAKVKWIAEESGGEQLELTASTSVQSALSNAIANLRMRYTLGFNPANPGESGSFHKLAVKFASADICPGCRLLARTGYYTGISSAPPPEPKAGQIPSADSLQKADESLVKQCIITAATSNLLINDIPFRGKITEQKDAKGQPEMKLDLQIDMSNVEFATVEDKHSCKLRVAIFILDETGKILGNNWRMIEGMLSEETYNKTQKAGLAFSAEVPIKAPNQVLKVIIYDEGSGKVGSKVVRLYNPTAPYKQPGVF
jgi:VWFA-related protein